MNPPAAAVEPLRKRVSRAIGLLAALSVVARIVLFAANWVLGGLLSQHDFGVSGLVLVVSTFAWTFVGFGLDDVIVQRGRGLRLWDGTAFRDSLAIATLCSVAVVAASPLIAWVFHEPRLVGPVMVIATSLPLAALSTVSSAKITAQMDFTFLVQWGVAELLITQALTIGFAIAGLGPYSFALPIPIIMGLRAIVYALRAPATLKKRQRWGRSRLLLRRGSMVAGSKFINYFVGQCDYVVLGLFATTIDVGYYYFAFRLAAAPVRAIAESLNTVLFPAMANFRSDPLQRSAAAVKSATMLAWLITPVCYFQIAVAGPALHLFFGDKWNDSIPIIQLLSIGLGIEGLMAVTRAYLKAAGSFNTALIYSACNAIGFFGACLIGVFANSTVGVALAISIYYLATQPALFTMLVDHTGRRFSNFISIFIVPSVTSAVAFGAAWAASQVGWLPHNPLSQILATTVIGWPLFLILFVIAAPDAMKQFRTIANDFLSRRRGVVAGEIKEKSA